MESTLDPATSSGQGCPSASSSNAPATPANASVRKAKGNAEDVEMASTAGSGSTVPAESEAAHSSQREASDKPPSKSARPQPGPNKLEEWDWKRFRRRAILREAARNHGRVELVEDCLQARLVAVKAMPTSWVCESPAAFSEAHPEENERPWCDITATYHLSRVARLSCVCTFLGVYRRLAAPVEHPASNGSAGAMNSASSTDGTSRGGAADMAIEGQVSGGTMATQEDHDETCLVLSYCAGGDLFSWLERSLAAGRNGACRETPARPLIRRLFLAVASVHAQGLAHGDLSLENVLLADQQAANVVLIDFGASTGPKASGVRGKPSYQAPEMHTAPGYDSFLADAFSLGVVVFSLVVGDYPWQSTRHQRCSKFMFYTQKGMVAYLSRRKVQTNEGEIRSLADILSPEVTNLMAGLLHIDPLNRLSVTAALESPWLREPGPPVNSSSVREPVREAHAATPQPDPRSPQTGNRRGAANGYVGQDDQSSKNPAGSGSQHGASQNQRRAGPDDSKRHSG